MRTGIVKARDLQAAGNWTAEFWLDPAAGLDKAIQKTEERLAQSQARLAKLLVQRDELLAKRAKFVSQTGE